MQYFEVSRRSTPRTKNHRPPGPGRARRHLADHLNLPRVTTASRPVESVSPASDASEARAHRHGGDVTLVDRRISTSRTAVDPRRPARSEAPAQRPCRRERAESKDHRRRPDVASLAFDDSVECTIRLGSGRTDAATGGDDRRLPLEHSARGLWRTRARWRRTSTSSAGGSTSSMPRR